MPSNIMLAEEFVRWEFKTLSAPLGVGFVSLGSITLRPAKQIIVTSTASDNLIISFSNPPTDQLRVAPGNITPQTVIVDLRGSNAALPAQTQISVRALVGAATGLVTVTLVQ